MKARSYGWRETVVPMLALFSSLGTLICCALPALLVTIGLGAAVAGLVSAAPQLVVLSEHKGWVFGLSGATILGAAFVHVRSRNLPCPADAGQAQVCARLRRASIGVLAVAASAWTVGLFFAYLAAPLIYGS